MELELLKSIPGLYNDEHNNDDHYDKNKNDTATSNNSSSTSSSAATRLTRRSEGSPSNKSPPEIKKFEDNKEEILAHTDQHPGNYADCELLYPLEKSKAPNSQKANQ